MGWVNTASRPPRAMTSACCARGLDASSSKAPFFASAKREPAFMLKELSTTTSISLSFTPLLARRMKGFANASTSNKSSAARKVKSSRYRSRRWRVELWVPRSKNINELNGRGVVT